MNSFRSSFIASADIGTNRLLVRCPFHLADEIKALVDELDKK
jgi:hypothetical protein